MTNAIYSKLMLGLLVLVFSASTLASEIKAPAPDFTLKSNSGENLRLSDFRGEVVMINFWATWCGPCRQEMPLLDELYQRYSKAGFTLFGVNVENDPKLSEKLLSELKVSFPILYDTTSDVSKMYRVDAMPTTVIVDRDGNMRFLHRGYKPGYEDDYRDQIKQLIRE